MQSRVAIQSSGFPGEPGLWFGEGSRCWAAGAASSPGLCISPDSEVSSCTSFPFLASAFPSMDTRRHLSAGQAWRQTPDFKVRNSQEKSSWELPCDRNPRTAAETSAFSL